MTPILEISNLTRAFRSPDGGWTTIIAIPELRIAAGEQVALEGGSGSGKTTLLHLIAGILRPDDGTIRIAGEPITGISEAACDRLRARRIGYVFQTFNLLQGYTALENVALGMRFGRGVDVAFARRLLERVGLAERMNYRPRQLSVGQQQRVAVARALANRPALVLADEPTGNLDRRHAGAALDLIREICRENQAALLLVSHDPEILARFERVERLADINRAPAAHAAPPATDRKASA